MPGLAREIERRFAAADVRLTLGGEPTLLPNEPKGSEWSYAAIGETKLSYARKFVTRLLEDRMQGGLPVFSPGKLYPGEVNPRWAINVLANRDGSPVLDIPKRRKAPTPESLRTFRRHLQEALGIRDTWLRCEETNGGNHPAWVLPLDYHEGDWRSQPWPLSESQRRLIPADGPAGLRLPLNELPEEITRRALTLQIEEKELALFLPPLIQEGFLSLLETIRRVCETEVPGTFRFQGVVPEDAEERWIVAKAAADPGVLEINLPPCAGWEEYAGWMETVQTCGAAIGMRTWKYKPGDFPEGTGGGNHLLFGAPSVDENPFFTRPGWLARFLSFFQRHPALAYAFTGCYVGASSQAPRADESARDLYDLEMAYRFIEELPEGEDHRAIINETVKHLHNDMTGNAHRAEISFDKFWNPGWPAGCLGLIEFRAIESLPKPEQSSAVALLWLAIAAYTLSAGKRLPLHPFRRTLHDRYFLPAFIWQDLERIFEELREAGLELNPGLYRDCWEWRFPVLLEAGPAGRKLVVRRAHESWPLLSETPIDGGTTSRFVDTSLRRLEFLAEPGFTESSRIFVNGRELRLQTLDGIGPIAGLRYRHSRLHPSLHPGIPVELPLEVRITDLSGNETLLAFRLDGKSPTFRRARHPKPWTKKLPPIRTHKKGEITADLRL